MISDCILAGQGDCKALTERHMHCGTRLCPFFKTKEQELQSQKHCIDRIGGNFKTFYKVGLEVD